jgi:hypothetical protein
VESGRGQDTSPETVWWDRGKLRKASVRISVVPAQIRTEQLENHKSIALPKHQNRETKLQRKVGTLLQRCLATKFRFILVSLNEGTRHEH